MLLNTDWNIHRTGKWGLKEHSKHTHTFLQISSTMKNNFECSSDGRALKWILLLPLRDKPLACHCIYRNLRLNHQNHSQSSEILSVGQCPDTIRVPYLHGIRYSCLIQSGKDEEELDKFQYALLKYWVVLKEKMMYNKGKHIPVFLACTSGIKFRIYL